MHREASSVVADAYELYSNAYERSILLRDLYGKETLLFTVTTGSEESKERAKKGLNGVLEGLEGERRKRVLAALKENLTTVCVDSLDAGLVAYYRPDLTTRIRGLSHTLLCIEHCGNTSLR